MGHNANDGDDDDDDDDDDDGNDDGDDDDDDNDDADQLTAMQQAALLLYELPWSISPPPASGWRRRKSLDYCQQLIN